MTPEALASIAGGTNAGRVTVRPRRGLSSTPLHVAVIAVCLLWMTPTMGLLVSSLREKGAIASSGWWAAFQHPFEFTLENYAAVISQNNMGQSFVNSLIIAIPGTVFPVLLAAFAAYAFAWMQFRGRDALFVATISLLVVPVQTTLIPVLRLLTWSNLVGTFPSIWLAHTGYGLPFAIFLLRNFFAELPKELLESAFLDGASELTAFFRVVLPLSVPALASLAIFQFLWVWNDLLVALVYLQDPAKAPMTLTLTNLLSSFGAEWHLLTSAAFISMALPLVIFFALQRYFVEGITAGAVKG